MAGKALALAVTLAPVTVHLSLLPKWRRLPARALGQGMPEIEVEGVCSRLAWFPELVVVLSM